MIRTASISERVYFIQDQRGAVKIGHATDPASRLCQLQVGNAGPLRFIRIIDGGASTERWLHRRFEHLKLRGEWFQFDTAMLNVIPPDELPQRAIEKPRLRLTLKETLRNHDRFPMISSDDPRLLAMMLISSFSDEDAADLIEWVRERVDLPAPANRSAA